jgi:hypothetical protein
VQLLAESISLNSKTFGFEPKKQVQFLYAFLMKVTFDSLLENKSKFPLDFLKLSSDCIIWPKYKNELGYGQFRYKSNGINYNCLAHRASYAYYNNDMPGKNDVIMHSCDNPSCINPLHLSKGTHADNVKDCMKKGRRRKY